MQEMTLGILNDQASEVLQKEKKKNLLWINYDKLSTTSRMLADLKLFK